MHSHRLARLTLVLLIAFGGSFAPVLGAGIPVTGEVTKPDGRPATGARVELLPIPGAYASDLELLGEPAPEARAAGRVGADGHFRLEAPEIGMWRVHVEADGHVPRVFDLEPLLEATDLPALELVPDAGLDLRLAAETPRAGRVLVRPAEPREGRFLRGVFGGGSWEPALRFAQLDAEGRTRLPAGADENLELVAVVAGSAPIEREIGRSRSVRLEPEAGVERRLEVIDPRGEPLLGIAIFAGESLPLAKTDDKGRATIVLGGSKTAELLLAGPWGAVSHLLEKPPAEGEEGPARVVVTEPPAIAGRVIDFESRESIADALVWPIGFAGEFQWTDARGGYRFDFSVDGQMAVAAASPEHLTGFARLSESEGDPRRAPTLALTPTATLTGRVVDAEGRGLEGVEIGAAARRAEVRGRFSFDIRNFQFGSSSQGLSTSEGAFTLRVPGGAAYRLSFAKEGYAPAELDLGRVETRERRDDLVVEMGAGLEGFGRVVDHRERPVAGAEVRLAPAQADEGSRRGRRLMSQFLGGGEDEEAGTLTDREGAFRLADLAPGRYQLEVEAEGFASIRVPGIELTRDQGEVDLGTVELAPGAVVAGRVVDPEGVPVQGAEVRVVENLGFSPPAFMLARFANQLPVRSRSDATGRFEIGSLPPETSVDLVVDSEGFVATVVPGVETGDGETVEVVLQPAGRLAGRVLDADRRPIAKASVLVQGEGRGGSGRLGRRGLLERGETDAEGRFEIENVPPGRVRLEASASGYQDSTLSGLEVEAGAVVEGLEMILREGAVIEGTVLDPEGRPAIGARVSIFDPGGGRFSFGGETAFTDGDGHYRLDGVEPGRHGVEAELDGYRRAAHDFAVEPGVNRLDLRLGGGVEASGWVIDDRGAAVAGAGVYLRGDGIGSSSFTATSGAEGRFTITDVSPGDYRLGARKEGFADVLIDEVVNVRDEPVTGLEVVLGRGATLTGQITGLELDELSRLRLRVFSQKGMREGEVDYDGLYRVANLAPGEWRVLAQVDDGGRQVSGEVVIEEAQIEARLDLDFGQGYVVEGVAILNGTSPIVGARISISRLGGGYAGSTQTRHDGGFRIEDVEEGSYRLNLREIGGLSHTEEIEVEGDTEVRLDVVTAEISGFVRDALDRVPLEGVSVSLEVLEGDSTGRRWPATSDSRGYFSLGQVGAGEYRLTAEKSGYAPSSTNFVLNPEAPEELELELRPTEGVRFEVALSSGITPDSVQAVVLSGGEKIVGGVYPTLQGGLVRLAKVPEGTWELVLAAGGSAVESRVFTAPGHLGRIVLGPGGELEVTVPELAEENVSASLTLIGPGGRPHRVPVWGGGVRSGFSLSRGKSRVSNLAVGLWLAEVRASDGRVWTGSVNVVPGDGNLLVLQ